MNLESLIEDFKKHVEQIPDTILIKQETNSSGTPLDTHYESNADAKIRAIEQYKDLIKFAIVHGPVGWK